jgi:hypothetical protein
MPNALRKQLIGFTNDHDRLWQLTSPLGNVEAATDYNWEITGFTPGLKDNLHYGANAYYWLDEYRKRGWKVEHIEDRHG